MKIWKTIKLNKVTKQDLEKAGINVSDYGGDMLEKVEFKKETVNLVRKTVGELGFETYATLEKIYAKAKEIGLELCPASLGPALRLEYKDEPLNESLYIGMAPITDRRGGPNVFDLARDTGGLWLGHDWASPGSEWDPGVVFVFCLRKSLKDLDSSVPPLALGSFDPLKLTLDYDGRKFKVVEVLNDN